MKSSESLQKRVKALEKRNVRVEADKAWETSWLRRIAIILLTYLTVVVYLQFVVHINPWLNAVVPVYGFFLSTITVTFLKWRWIEHRTKR